MIFEAEKGRWKVAGVERIWNYKKGENTNLKKHKALTFKKLIQVIVVQSFQIYTTNTLANLGTKQK